MSPYVHVNMHLYMYVYAYVCIAVCIESGVYCTLQDIQQITTKLLTDLLRYTRFQP